MDVARLNFSHGDAETHAETARRVRDAAGRAGRQVVDPAGPAGAQAAHRRARGRPGRAQAGRCVDVRLRRARRGQRGADVHRLAGLAESVDTDEIMYLADGRIRLRVQSARPGDGEIDAMVEIGGAVASRQGLNIPGEAASLPSVPAEDLEHVRTGEKIGVDLVALSFVRRAEDITSLREHTRLPLIAKIEKPQAVQRAEEIVRAADCVMVARGDLGIELRIEDVPIVQKQVHRAGRRAGAAVDHRDADARLDGRLLAPHARRGHRRRERDPRRDRRGDALAGERGRAVPDRRRGDDGLDRRAHRADGAIPPVERAPRAPRPPRPGLHRRLHGLPGGPRAGARRARVPDAVRALGAA